MLLALAVVVLVIVVVELGTRLVIHMTYGPNVKKKIWTCNYEPYVLHLSSRWDKKNWREFFEKSRSGEKRHYRILLLGGSTAQACPAEIIEEAFRPLIGEQVEVVNLAQVAYLIRQDAIMLLLYGSLLRPDLIISLDGANDLVNVTKTKRPGVHWNAEYVEYAVNHPVRNALRMLANNSKFIHALLKLRERSSEIAGQQDAERFARMMEIYLQSADSMAVLSQGFGAQYVCVLQPYLFLRKSLPEGEQVLARGYAYRRQFMIHSLGHLDAGLSRHVFPAPAYYVSALAAFDATDTQCFYDEVHLTLDGYRALWNYVVRQLRDRGFRFHLDSDNKTTPVHDPQVMPHSVSPDGVPS